MPIPVPIPVSAKYIATVHGAVWKVVCCAQCHQRFGYQMELTATGEHHDPLFLDGEGAAQRAQAQAEENLKRKSERCVLTIPCPTCGFYQPDMVQLLKDDASINRWQIAGVVIAAASLIPLAFGIPYLWIATLVMALAGLSVLGYGYAKSIRFDPNAGDTESRKSLGRLQTIWGPQLEALLGSDGPDSASTAIKPA